MESSGDQHAASPPSVPSEKAASKHQVEALAVMHTILGFSILVAEGLRLSLTEYKVWYHCPNIWFGGLVMVLAIFSGFFAEDFGSRCKGIAFLTVTVITGLAVVSLISFQVYSLIQSLGNLPDHSTIQVELLDQILLPRVSRTVSLVITWSFLLYFIELGAVIDSIMIGYKSACFHKPPYPIVPEVGTAVSINGSSTPQPGNYLNTAPSTSESKVMIP